MEDAEEAEAGKSCVSRARVEGCEMSMSGSIGILPQSQVAKNSESTRRKGQEESLSNPKAGV